MTDKTNGSEYYGDEEQWEMQEMLETVQIEARMIMQRAASAKAVIVNGGSGKPFTGAMIKAYNDLRETIERIDGLRVR